MHLGEDDMPVRIMVEKKLKTFKPSIWASAESSLSWSVICHLG